MCSMIFSKCDFIVRARKDLQVSGLDKPFLYTGSMTMGDKNSSNSYMGGGAGYILSKKTVKALVEDVFPNCHQKTVGSAEVRF